MDKRTYVRTDGWTFETHFIRSTQKSRPNNTQRHPNKLKALSIALDGISGAQKLTSNSKF